MSSMRWAVPVVTAAMAIVTAQGASAESQVERGRYLVTIGGCGDCHTPGHLLGKPDMTRVLGGSDVGFAIPGEGVFVGPNLTRDKETGLGSWTDKQIVTALTTGVRPDGRVLAPVMPWRALSHLTHADAMAIVAYLRSLPAVQHRVPGPFGASEKPSVFVMTVLPPEVYAGIPQPSAEEAAAPAAK